VEGTASNQDSRSTGSTEEPTTFDPEATSDWRGEFRGTAAVKPISPLDGDPERSGLKKTPELCVLVYVGPGLRCQKQHKQQCMTVKSDDGAFLSDQSRLEYPHLEPCTPEVDLDEPQEFQLEPGERYG